MPADPKINIPKVIISEFSVKENNQFNQALAKYVEIQLLKKQGKSVSGLYKPPKLNVAGLSKARNQKLNRVFAEGLQRQLDQVDVVAFGPIVLAIAGGIVGNILGNVINDLITDKCSD